MTTTSTPQLDWAAQQWERNCGRRSAVFAGIVPDKAHLRDGGPHVSINDLKAYGNYPDYSTPSPYGRPPAVKTLTTSSAIDMSQAKADMVMSYGRVMIVFNDRSDPRRKYINAINCWSGSGSPKRVNFQTNSIGIASSDHTWHEHADFVRSLWDAAAVGADAAWKAARAFVSIMAGESKAAWIAKEEGGTTASLPNTGDDMATTIWYDGTVYGRGNGVTSCSIETWAEMLRVQARIKSGHITGGAAGSNIVTTDMPREFGVTVFENPGPTPTMDQLQAALEELAERLAKADNGLPSQPTSIAPAISAVLRADPQALAVDGSALAAGLARDKNGLPSDPKLIRDAVTTAIHNAE